MTVTTWKTDEATQAQLDFIDKLAAERVGGAEALEQLPHDLTKGEASGIISRLKTSPFQAPVGDGTKMATGTKYDNPVIGKGYFTVTDDNEGHKTFRVSPNQSWCDGKTVIGMLTGHSNQFSYTGIGFVTNEGIKLFGKAKARFGEDQLRHWTDVLVADWTGAAQLTIEMAQQYVLTSGNCFVCGKLLTDPESIGRGIGPVCWKSINEWTTV